MFTFRTSITFAVMAFIVALTALLIAIQVRSLHWATREAASAYMDETSTKAFGRLQTEITAISSLVNVLATSSSVADLNERTEIGPAILRYSKPYYRNCRKRQYLCRFRKWRLVAGAAHERT